MIYLLGKGEVLMRILLLTSEFNPFNSGGLGRYVNKIFELLAAKPDVQIDVLNILTYVKAFYRIPFEGSKKTQIGRSTILHCDTQIGYSFASETDAETIVRQHINQLNFPYDIIFVQDSHYAYVTKILFEKNLIRYIVLFTHLSASHYEKYEPCPEKDLQIQRKNSEKIIEKLSHLFITPSHHAKKLLNSSGQYTAKFNVVRLATDVKLAQEISDRLPYDKWKNLTPLRLISIGRFVQQKAPFYLHDVIKICRNLGINFHMTWIGEGELRAEVESRLATENLNDYVTIIHSHIDEKEIFKHLAQNHIFVSTSLFETFGFAILEAMAAECVPICFNNTAIPELIDSDKVGFLIENERPGLIAQQILALSKQPELMKKTALNAKAKSSQYTWEKHANDLTQLFHSVMNKMASPRGVEPLLPP
jgi:glycosyltransferase involved in cell wall biosynthesis